MKLTEDVKGAVNRFKCDAPMNLVGDKELTCNGKIWSGPVPTCECNTLYCYHFIKKNILD